MSPITFIALALAAFATALPADQHRPGFSGGYGRPFGPAPPTIGTGTGTGTDPAPAQPTTQPTEAGPPTQPAAGSGLTCDTSAAVLTVPSGLPAPNGKLAFVLFGVGIQNYTCKDDGTHASSGAVAELFDLSCLSNKDPAAFESVDSSAASGPKLGAHFFQPNPQGTGISPVWDFRGNAAQGNADAFVLGAKKFNVAAPTGSQDVDWVQIDGVSGALATSIYRSHTKGGQPPASCVPGSPEITVQYSSKYWLYGGSVTL